MAYTDMTRDELQAELKALETEYASIKAQGLKLNMARGKPGREQLDIVSDMLTVLSDADDCFADGMDARNYGELCGLPSARAYFADLMGTRPENVFVGGSASLQLMYGLIAKGCTNGLKNSEKPWACVEDKKFLCPAPGYDRHFRVTESLGFTLVTIPMTDEGPDMDAVEEAIKDPSVKGIWCVPKYSNPDGIIYSERVLDRFVHLKPAAPDFTVMWDNAYCIHEFEGDYVPFPSILALAKEAGTEDMFYEFASTSKVTFPGAGISCMVCSDANMAYLKKLLGAEIISYDKLNQLRHVRYLKNKQETLALMKKHATVLGPKFAMVLKKLDAAIAPLGIARYTRPSGGYFVSYYAMPGTAKRIWNLCKEAGVVLTDAGAAYPYGKDPVDSHIRIAPSLPPIAELDKAMDVFCVCARIAAIEKLLG